MTCRPEAVDVRGGGDQGRSPDDEEDMVCMRSPSGRWFKVLLGRNGGSAGHEEGDVGFIGVVVVVEGLEMLSKPRDAV